MSGLFLLVAERGEIRSERATVANASILAPLLLLIHKTVRGRCLGIGPIAEPFPEIRILCRRAGRIRSAAAKLMRSEDAPAAERRVRICGEWSANG